jgi:DNA-binding NarL/FixJ family response regulator
LRALESGHAPVDGHNSPKLRISVLVVDTQALFRSGLAKLLSEDDRLFVAAISDGGEDVPELCAALSIDVVVSDMRLRNSDGIELTRTIASTSPDTRVLILASMADWRVIPALTSGAAGFLLKDTDPEAIRSAVVSAHLGGQVVCQEAAPWLLQDSPDHRLTRRESDILQLVARGAANKEIADLLQLGDKTVRNYVSRLYRKLAVQERSQFRSLALHAGCSTRHRTNLSRRAAGEFPCGANDL